MYPTFTMVFKNLSLFQEVISLNAGLPDDEFCFPEGNNNPVIHIPDSNTQKPNPGTTERPDCSSVGYSQEDRQEEVTVPSPPSSSGGCEQDHRWDLAIPGPSTSSVCFEENKMRETVEIQPPSSVSSLPVIEDCTFTPNVPSAVCVGENSNLKRTPMLSLLSIDDYIDTPSMLEAGFTIPEFEFTRHTDKLFVTTRDAAVQNTDDDNGNAGQLRTEPEENSPSCRSDLSSYTPPLPP